MIFPLGEAACDQILRALEIDDADILASMHEDIAIGALKRGAGDHSVLAGLADPVDLVGDRLQPRPAIFVDKRLAGSHFGDIAQGVKLVAILEAPAQSLGQFFPDSALARARHAHPDKHERRSAALIFHDNLPAALPYPRARSFRPWNARDSRAGSRLQARASRSRACPRQRSRTAFRGRS